jgi:hypothetical protein
LGGAGKDGLVSITAAIIDHDDGAARQGLEQFDQPL